MTYSILLLALTVLGQASDFPRSLDPRLEVIRFAAAPDIVHPIALDFDAKGRLLVIESHTHFRPKDYKGPPTDRIRVVEDTDGDGKADSFTTFFDNLTAAMDLAVHPDGSVYVATRNEILRLFDADGDGKADQWSRIVFLKTDGNYPHNGLSGLAFDARGDLYFGLGENLGATYELLGRDERRHRGGGEGGSVFWCSKDGDGLRRVATGFWNPFGVCRDVFGRLFAVDNDPDSRPPCRLVHVVEGGDYGYHFRYGRSGRHPFQAWNGELPGTLPYVAGVGEAPCEVLSYESDGLPDDYRGDLLVTSWGDHRLERYRLKPRGASYSAEKQVVVQGGKNFRPVGLATAPDGSLFLSDWVRRDYTLHGEGAIWHVRKKDGKPATRPADPREALKSPDAAVRNRAARTLASTAEGIEFLKARLGDSDPRVRAAAIDAIGHRGDVDLEAVFRKDPVPEVGAMAVRAIAARTNRRPDFWFPDDSRPVVRAELLAGWTKYWSDLLELPDDPFLRQAAVRKLANTPGAILRPLAADVAPRTQIDLFLALRESDKDRSQRLLRELLDDPLEEIRFLTAKWIADERLNDGVAPLRDALAKGNISTRLHVAYATALARLDGQPVNEARLVDIFLKQARNAKADPASRVLALRGVPASSKGLTTEQLVEWLSDPAFEMRLEAVRALGDAKSPQGNDSLLKIARDAGVAPRLRREALTALAGDPRHTAMFLELAVDEPVAADAVRALTTLNLKESERKRLQELAERTPALKPLIDRTLGAPGGAAKRDVAEWLKRLDGPADAEAGRLVFFHPRLAACSRCHRVDGRGADIGPDLSSIGQRDREAIVTSIVVPSRDVAPHFQTWQIETDDGKIRNGFLVHTNDDQSTYIDDKGQPFTVTPADVVSVRPATTSIMPDGAVDALTDQEFRDLIAYLLNQR